MSADFRAKKKLELEILQDRGNLVAASYGIAHDVPEDLREVYGSFGIDLEANNAAGDQRLPLPATFIVDTAGIVTYAEVDPDYRIRPEPEDVLAALGALVK